MEKNDYLIQVVAKDGFVAEIIQRQATGEDVIKTANLLKDNPKAERVNIRNITRTERRIVCNECGTVDTIYNKVGDDFHCFSCGNNDITKTSKVPEKPNNSIECDCCYGDGVYDCVAQMMQDDGSFKYEPPVEMICQKCKGYGYITAERQLELIREEQQVKEMWCQCETPSDGDVIHENINGQDYYSCPKCRKLVQVG